MKEVFIKVTNASNYNIIIKKNHHTLINEYVNNNQAFCFKGKLNEGYQLIIHTCIGTICTSFIIFKKSCIYTFSIPINENKKTFILYDANYYPLNLKRGELNLWPNPIL